MTIKGENIYDILGVDRNADKRTIKQAYANLVKQYHPEEQPEEWKRIHDAYEYAMKNASEQKRKVSVPISAESQERTKAAEPWQPPYERTEAAEPWQPPHERTEAAEPWQPPYERTEAAEQWQSPYERTETAEQWQSPYERTETAEQWQSPYEQIQEQEPEDIFENVEAVAHRQNEEEERAEKEKLESVIHQMHSLVWQSNFKKKEWKKFFEQDDLLPYTSRKEFLRELGDSFFLKKIKGDLYDYLDEQLNTIADYVQTYSTEQTGKRDMASVQYARHKIKVACQSKQGGGQKSKGISWAAILTINVVLTVLLRYMVTMDNQRQEQDRKERQQQAQEIMVQQNEMIKQQLSETQELISENPEMEEQIRKRVQEMLEDGTITQEYYEAYLKYFGIDETDTDQ